MASEVASQGHRGNLQVIVHSARQLAPADFKLLKKPSSDPYCVCSLGAQSFRTPTINENLNPTWEHPGSIIMGSFLPASVLKLMGETQVSEHDDTQNLHLLRFEVFDEDLMSADDSLGHCSVDLTDVFSRQEEWIQFELKLRPVPGMPAGGCLIVSACWEPAPFLPTYVLRIVSAIVFAVAAATCFLASQCRWQSSAASPLLSEPGVAAALLLASLTLILATAFHFVLAHAAARRPIDELAAEQSASQGLSDALSTYGVPGKAPTSDAPSLLSVKIHARGMMSYELGVSTTPDLFRALQLPLALLAWLLPIGGTALCGVAVLLQFVQRLPDWIYPGYVFGCFGFLAAASGLVLAVVVESGPRAEHFARKQKMKRHAALVRRKTIELSESNSVSTTQTMGRRSYVRQRVSTMFGRDSTVSTPSHQ